MTGIIKRIAELKKENELIKSINALKYNNYDSIPDNEFEILKGNDQKIKYLNFLLTHPEYI